MKTQLGRFSTRATRMRTLLLGVGLLAAIMRPSAQAGDGDWNIDAAGNWGTAANWLGSVVPGATSGTANPDAATFGFPLTAASTVTVDANRNVKNITFTDGNSSAFGYTLSGTLSLTDGGAIISSGSSGAHTDTIGNAVVRGDGGSYRVSANSTLNSRLLVIGGFTGASTAGNTTTLTLDGTNVGIDTGATGSNRAGGIAGDGSAGGRLAIVKDGPGTWVLGRANAHSGGTILNEGSPRAGNRYFARNRDFHRKRRC